MNESILPILLLACFGTLFILAAVGLIRVFRNWLLQHLALRCALFTLVGSFIGLFLGFGLSAFALALIDPPVVEMTMLGEVVDRTVFVMLAAALAGLALGARSGYRRAGQINHQHNSQ